MFLKKIEIEAIRRCGADKTKIRFRTRPSTDISEILPYLNATYPDSIYYAKKPSLELKKDDAVILLESEAIVLNELSNTTQGIKFVDWVKDEINRVYKNKDQIEPDYTSKENLSVPELYKNLPQLNCGKCGEVTCLAFATKFVKGEYQLEDCSPLLTAKYKKVKKRLEDYI
ncbi:MULTISPECIES: (Fe-S)-binding protein [unclassified Candidatus Frackibacter]|uniref:(Fe-S)-binding protein n=1 Tax=unclassified Candidatus Frackibacter TaxID=2648818 RepID=UPI00088EFC39|nr:MULTISPECIES: (Fe-S)-binding protein [unclassified Candidatus Frackibacter]SDC00245.1 Metal-binding trascriptional regulator, contains putative Fe-S cluster and ArsR family DNA binding domain [Candidatus Frackibacter sp. WG11]SEM31763.1 Metal-binding trascriptional regulator, contains putative Fe-S cluster and ArsR family DNA binding domain [Candidatus Frackibacter sp. WG12]SFL36680.1 Metal-binding trascriptional regulator, contains putative Fe-S cluster and ArsR family DNA binding domain [Ca